MLKRATIFSERNRRLTRKPFVIFYAWQSDLPNKTNRTFIEDCLNEAIKELNDSNNFQHHFSLDKDTSGEAGMPAISDTILRKIDSCDIFVGDISIVNKTVLELANSSNIPSRAMPNPNVFFEFGYAVSKLGWSNVICLFNTAYSAQESVPFDVQHRRTLSYDYSLPKLLLCNDYSAVIQAQQLEYTHVLTKEDDIWKLFKLIYKNGEVRREDISSDRKIKAIIKSLNKKESNVNPEDLRNNYVKQIEGTLNDQKSTVKKLLKSKCKEAILKIHAVREIEAPKRILEQILDFLNRHAFRCFDGENKNKPLNEILSSIGIEGSTLKCQLTADGSDKNNFLIIYPKLGSLLALNNLEG